MTIRGEIYAKINELIQKAEWNEPRTISGFIEDAVIKEVKRVERVRRSANSQKAVH